MVKCKDCKYAIPHISNETEGMCSIPVPWWAHEFRGQNPYISMTKNHNCSVFEKAEETENG